MNSLGTLRCVAVIALTVAAISGCGQSNERATGNPERVDTMVINANGYTMADGTLSRFSTLVVADGRVVAAGDEQLAERYDAKTVVDVNGKTVLPGLIDAHGHVSSLGVLRQSLDLAGIASLDSTLGAIAAFDRTLPDEARWLLGRGWNQVIWEGQQFPNKEDIDAVVSERAVFLRRIDGHAAWANTQAMTLAGIDADTQDPPGGKIIRDENGDATGVLIDAAMGLVERVVPSPSLAEQRGHLVSAMEELASLGVTGVHDAGSSRDEVMLYQQIADDGEMPIRVSAMLGGMETLALFDEPIDSYADDLFSATSVKLYADGALGSRGAAMIEDYSDDAGNKGLLFANEEGLADMIRTAHQKGFAAHIHAIGDRANQAALDAFAIVNEGQPTDFHDRVEHAQVVALPDIDRFAELDIIASVQPTHATSDMNMAEDRVGSERILGAYAWQRMLKAGVRIAGGSDFPVEKPEMFDGLYAAVSRKDKDGNPVEGWYPDQALSREQALAAFTIWASDSVNQGDRIGELTQGMWADFIVIDRDYFTIPEIEIWQIQTLQTWVAGKPVFTLE
ncbi:MAG: amidohydrolase [Pseudomonadota bacterium]